MTVVLAEDVRETAGAATLGLMRRLFSEMGVIPMVRPETSPLLESFLAERAEDTRGARPRQFLGRLSDEIA